MITSGKENEAAIQAPQPLMNSLHDILWQSPCRCSVAREAEPQCLNVNGRDSTLAADRLSFASDLNQGLFIPG
jgi:hypothetical protein